MVEPAESGATGVHCEDAVGSAVVRGRASAGGGVMLRLAVGILSLLAAAGYVEVVVAHFRPDIAVSQREILAAVALTVLTWVSLYSSLLETTSVCRAIARIARRIMEGR